MWIKSGKPWNNSYTQHARQLTAEKTADELQNLELLRFKRQLEARKHKTEE
jgi:hypothetical protein